MQPMRFIPSPRTSRARFPCPLRNRRKAHRHGTASGPRVTWSRCGLESGAIALGTDAALRCHRRWQRLGRGATEKHLGYRFDEEPYCVPHLYSLRALLVDGLRDLFDRAFGCLFPAVMDQRPHCIGVRRSVERQGLGDCLSLRIACLHQNRGFVGSSSSRSVGDRRRRRLCIDSSTERRRRTT